MTLGLQIMSPDGRQVLSPVIRKDSSIPCEKLQSYSTVDGQASINIVVLEGEEELAYLNHEVGRFSISID